MMKLKMIVVELEELWVVRTGDGEVGVIGGDNMDKILQNDQ